MKITKLPDDIMDELKAHKVKTITFNWSGGSDEGYLNLDFVQAEDATTKLKWDHDLYKKIEKWAWENDGYNGAGDGHDYGDDVCYNLETNTVTHETWYMERTEEGQGEYSYQELPKPNPDVFITKCGKRYIRPEHYTTYAEAEKLEYDENGRLKGWPQTKSYECLVDKYGEPVNDS